MNRRYEKSEREIEVTTRLRLLAVPRSGLITRGQYSQQAIHELEQQGYATPVEIDHRGKVKAAKISAQGRIAQRHLLSPSQDTP